VSALPNRRYFLVRFLAMLVRRKEADSAITRFSPDAFLVECGELHCGVGRQDDDTWLLGFNVYRTTKTWWGGTEERMVPSAALQQRLAEIGITVEYDGHPTYRSLVGRSEVPVDPGELLQKMQVSLAAVDEGLLYTVPRE
jgi:hypothetical protein